MGSYFSSEDQSDVKEMENNCQITYFITEQQKYHYPSCSKQQPIQQSDSSSLSSLNLPQTVEEPAIIASQTSPGVPPQMDTMSATSIGDLPISEKKQEGGNYDNTISLPTWSFSTLDEQSINNRYNK